MAKKKNVVAPPESNKIFISYYESREGGEAIDPECSWPSYEPAYIDVSFDGYKSEHVNDFSGRWLDSFDVTDEVFALAKTGVDLHLVVARYSDGDTFSSTNGYWKILHITADSDEAYRIEKILDDSNGNTIPSECNMVTYNYWSHNYFGGWERAEVRTIRCLDKKS